MQGDGSVVGHVECTDLDGGSAHDRKSVVGYRPNVASVRPYYVGV